MFTSSAIKIVEVNGLEFISVYDLLDFLHKLRSDLWASDTLSSDATIETTYCIHYIEDYIRGIINGQKQT